jgi:hypothetical protein
MSQFAVSGISGNKGSCFQNALAFSRLVIRSRYQAKEGVMELKDLKQEVHFTRGTSIVVQFIL